MKTQSKNKADKKITNEKPVSLNGLSLKQALAALLATKPPEKEPKKQKSSKSSK